MRGDVHATPSQPGHPADPPVRDARTAAPTGRWHRLGPPWAIPPGEGRVYAVAGAQIAVFRTRAGELFATQARCPHKSGPLADGIVGPSSVVCPLHAFKFNLATGTAVGNPCSALTTYPVTLGQAGDMLVSLTPHMPPEEDAVTSWAR